MDGNSKLVKAIGLGLGIFIIFVIGQGCGQIVFLALGLISSRGWLLAFGSAILTASGYYMWPVVGPKVKGLLNYFDE